MQLDGRETATQVKSGAQQVPGHGYGSQVVPAPRQNSPTPDWQFACVRISHRAWKNRQHAPTGLHSAQLATTRPGWRMDPGHLSGGQIGTQSDVVQQYAAGGGHPGQLVVYVDPDGHAVVIVGVQMLAGVQQNPMTGGH